jgi:hypothetical protein
MRMDSFPQILFSVWESKTTGMLVVKNDKTERELVFSQGELVIDKDHFDEQAFLKHLVKKKILDSSSAKKSETRATKNKTTFLAALLDTGSLTPPFLWKNMEVFAKLDLYPLFDLTSLAPSLLSEKGPSENSILFTIPTLGLIRDGIYRMKNFKLIDTLLPKTTEDFQKLSPEYLDLIDLQPYEKQLIHAISEKTGLQSLLNTNTLGEKYTKKALFALFCLGILGSPPMATPDKPLQEFSAVELQKILDTFNAKCSYIYKSVSKELGPVSLNLMEKSIDDVKPDLSQHFQKIRLGIDGKIDLHSVLKSNIILSDRETVHLIIKSLNEILAAEILAVKKTLGSDFEASLIKNLESIGG